MSAVQFRQRITEALNLVWETQTENIEKVSAVMADCIARGGLVHLFGSGHSVLPVQDMFPRYGAFPGFRPLMDMRLMWTNVIGSGGAKGLLWLERREGYASAVLFEN
ncbi:MAG: SIS domain-containing protein, partial [Candidatus Sulfotelmatobacter sp.]